MQPDIVFVLAGQSNMSGRGDVSPSDAAPTSLPVLVMNMDGTWRRASEPLHAGVDEKELRELAGSPSKPPPGKGPGMMFARRCVPLAPRADLPALHLAALRFLSHGGWRCLAA